LREDERRQRPCRSRSNLTEAALSVAHEIEAGAAPQLLEIAGLTKAFGSVVVADRLDLTVARGEALGIIGPNGAGKTTLFGLISGSLRADGGQISLDGREVGGVPAHQRCRAGIARTHQIPHPFANLTVFENLLVAATHGRGSRGAEAADVCAQVLETTALMPAANRLAGSLTLLQRKRLEMARALASGPELLLLDETAGGLSESECHELVATIRAVHESGVTIIWIEHIVHALLAVVGRLVVLNFGRKIAEGDPAAVMASAEVREIYMGIQAGTEG
jgi:branched-chain amino acid transport system ATP-binding protein